MKLNSLNIEGTALCNRSYMILSDLHFGHIEELHNSGILLPKNQLQTLIKTLGPIIQKYHPKRIILNGDIKHNFSTIKDREWREANMFLDFLEQYSSEIIIIKGNHDTILDPITKKRSISTVSRYIYEDTIITHGHKLIPIPDNIKTVIIGHDHPAIILSDGTTKENYKCYLKGTYQNKTLIVQPSSSFITPGTNILTHKLLSPYLTDINNFKVIIVADKPYIFGTVSEIKDTMH